jgi:hypothetical protein
VTYDPVRGRAILFGGTDGGHVLNDTWALEWPGPLGAAAPAEIEPAVPGRVRPLVFTVHAIAPNPTRGAFAVDLTLPGAREAELTVFDVHGALVQRADLGSLPAGRHWIPIGKREVLSPGIYLVQVRCGAEIRALKAVVLH